jgi:hypothetical protein
MKTLLDLERELEAAIEERREKYDMLRGAGSYNRNKPQHKPGRCVPWMEEALYGITEHYDFGTITNLFKCFFSKPGDEPKRIYPEAPCFDSIEEIKRQIKVLKDHPEN